MNKQEIQVLLTNIASIGLAIATGRAPTSAASFALGAVLREIPHLFAIASIVLSKGRVSPEDLEEAEQQTAALLDPASIPPAK